MDKQDLVEKVDLMVAQVQSRSFAIVRGRALFLNDAERLLFFVNNHKLGKKLNSQMFNELKFKFDALVRRTQAYEK